MSETVFLMGLAIAATTVIVVAKAIAGAFAGDATDTFNSHNWFNITQNNTGSPGVFILGGIWVATN